MTQRNTCIVPLLGPGGCATWSHIRVAEDVAFPIEGAHKVRSTGVDVSG
ncbi:MAG: hypothetical protein OXU33_04195 [Gemmatimonadota bacterium]|nr:hypothetical protein [Gemmatimonadota bacterium]MDE3006880.1 hypothetical protein [Gemmatimonadota bacterium]MDE3013251.1 hypothetical protein [Gemmatimonadota bacterium]